MPTSQSRSTGSREPTTSSSGPAWLRGGSRYHAERSAAGCWVPERQLPITGVRAGSRLYGSRARDPFTPAAAVVPPSVPASFADTVPVSVSAKFEVPGDSITGSADTSAGIPLGPKPSDVTSPSALLTGTPIGVSSPAFGSCSTITSLARPQVLP